MNENQTRPSLHPGNRRDDTLYVEVEDGERVVLPAGMTGEHLLRSALRQVLQSEQPLPGLPIRTIVVPCVWCGVTGNHDRICRDAS